MSIDLPISKSIANRLLILQALHGEPLLDIQGEQVPDDVLTLRQALQDINDGATQVQLKNCGTAMRFLTAYCAQLQGRVVCLNGSDRMHVRPIAQLVETLISCGADIWYEGERGYPPLRIRGNQLYAPLEPTSQHAAITVNSPDSSQFVSALLLIGLDVESNSASPYITMTRQIIDRYRHKQPVPLEYDWSSAAFWYEYVALHGGQLHLNGLRSSAIQGDMRLIKIYSRLGVSTHFDATGVTIAWQRRPLRYPRIIDFTNCPDLYPAVAITCHQLHIPLLAVGTEAQHIKESDRLLAVHQRRAYSDHRVAMALLAADYPCDDTECIVKSYPDFFSQLEQVRAMQHE